MTELDALWIGDSDSPEFAAAATILHSHARVVSFANAAQASEYLAADNPSPALVVLAQSYPGQFTAESVKPFRTAAPLARIIALLGTWCEGESRSGVPVPGTIRIYWHQFESRCLRELHQIRLGRCTSWGLAATATDDERLLMAELHSQSLASSEHTARLAAIVASSREMATFLSDACRSYGLSTVWYLPGEQIRVSRLSVVLWDAPTFLPEHSSELRLLKQASNNAPIIALLDFPRTDDHAAALRAGVSTILSKPLQLPDFSILVSFTQTTKPNTEN